ncbi:membrane protein [Paenibacillus swuensis]|uniref:Membrane protein n=1 Tax=Paenibacillus swuensis TaxID=1178515 RepID=A0A172THZ4_9BACL|nr:DUF1146 family protein [Paenibacillus swuensis]ANE46679.1 membrane protein [Paenibacillus swuensis]
MDPSTPTTLVSSIGLSGVINITVVLVCIILAWWSLQKFRFDVLMREPRSPQGKVLHVFLSVVIGYQVAKFIFDYVIWARMMKYIAI